MNNQAIILTRFGGTDATELSEIHPEPTPGVVVVRVRAASINGLDWKIREGDLRDVMPTVSRRCSASSLPVRPADPSGSRFAVGDRVFGLAAPGNGAYAEYVAVPEMLLAPCPLQCRTGMPRTLPVAGLDRMADVACGRYTKGRRYRAGARLLGRRGHPAGTDGKAAGPRGDRNRLGLQPASTCWTSASTHRDRPRREKFEDKDSGVDLVIDLAGADLPDRLGRCSAMVAPWSVGSLRHRRASHRGRRGIAVMMKPDSDRLASIARERRGRRPVKVTIDQTVPLAGIPAAIERNRTGMARARPSPTSRSSPKARPKGPTKMTDLYPALPCRRPQPHRHYRPCRRSRALTHLGHRRRHPDRPSSQASRPAAPTR